MIAIGTWNLENLFKPGSAFGPKTADIYDAKLTALAATITALGPDVLAVQEVGDPAALADLVDRLTGEWHVETATVFEAGHPIRVGFISQLPLTGIEQVTTFPDKLAAVQTGDDGATITAMPRGALKATVTTTTGVQVDLVACHLKSKLLSFPGGRFAPHDEGERARYGAYALGRRAAEAVTVREYVTGLLDGHGQDRAVIVLGDLNDEPLAATTQILLGPPGSELDTAGYTQPDQGDGQRLWNLAARIPADRRYTRKFNGRGELIDHLLASHRLVHALADIDTGIPVAQLPSITEQPAARRDAAGSDHSPVLAHFNL